MLNNISWRTPHILIWIKMEYKKKHFSSFSWNKGHIFFYFTYIFQIVFISDFVFGFIFGFLLNCCQFSENKPRKLTFIFAPGSYFIDLIWFSVFLLSKITKKHLFMLLFFFVHFTIIVPFFFHTFDIVWSGWALTP